MKTFKMGLALAAVLAMSGIGAGVASALPTTLTLDEETGHAPLAAGEGIRMVTETPVVIEAGENRIECQDKSDFSGFFGNVVTNNEKTDAISFTSGGFMFGEECEGSGALGSASVEPTGFPWNLSIQIKGKTKLTGSPKVGLEVNFSSGARCDYQKPNVAGSLTPTPIFGSEQRADFTFSGQKLALAKSASSRECPKTALFSAEFPEVISEASNQYVYDIANTIYNK